MQRVWMRGYYALKPWRLRENYPGNPFSFEKDDFEDDGYDPVEFISADAHSSLMKNYLSLRAALERIMNATEYLHDGGLHCGAWVKDVAFVALNSTPGDPCLSNPVQAYRLSPPAPSSTNSNTSNS
jgi:hypothetical protein